jgi:CubicO group peptidase (beta-lactamase class C family)
MRKSNSLYLTIIFLFVSISFTFPGRLQAEQGPTKGLAKKINAFLEKTYPANEPGAVVLAIKDGKIILRKGYGMANLELGIPIKPEMVFHIGSITKQFTAAAIMKLVEEGKLSVTDDIKKYLPNYPTHGHKITIHHLLNHTSGIKSYTSMTDWPPLMRKDMTPAELIDLFKNQPMDFAPGERVLYSNSGYILLGAIIEKVSGKSYEAYIHENIFKPLGMSNSYYGSNKRIIPNRVSGYEKGKKEITNASYLSMTLPYAGGSLVSTVDDLHRWYQALEAGKVISKKSLEQMYTPAKLNNGKTQNYAYGWLLGTLFGEKTIEHDGGINGFYSDALRVPEKKVFVTVLTNCPWRQPAASYVSEWIAAVLCGKELKEKKAVTLDTKTLETIVGVYKITEGEFQTIFLEGNQLYIQRGQILKLPVFAESETEFFFKAISSHFTIVKNKDGKVIKMIMHWDFGDEEAIKISDKPAADKKEK